MANTAIMATYVKKLSHPLKEIRERSLQLLVAKLQLGWELEDELSGTRELLEALLAWFDVHQPSLQREAFQLLLSTIKTKAGTYIAREFGIKQILSTLHRIKHKVEPNALELYFDVLETLKFLNTIESEDNVGVPPLALHSLVGSESDEGSSSSFYNIRQNSISSKETSVSNGESHVDGHEMSQTKDGIKVLLFPWVNMCPSDTKTLLLVEDALKLLKSTRRCCRFICDVFLRDFPAEIFLNRPNIIKCLMTIADSSRPGEALHVLLCITQALRMRLQQLSSLQLVHEASKLSLEHKAEKFADDVNVELAQMAGDSSSVISNEDDTLAALRQLPAPMFALDTLHAILSMMAKSIALLDPVDKSEVLDLKDSNTCISLIECLIQLLLDCVSGKFWCIEHTSKTHTDIAHRSSMVMRFLGDLLTKYRKSFFDDTSRKHHRITWIRLVSCAEKLLDWAHHSAMPLSSLAVALQGALLDPVLDLFYPELSRRISETLHNSKASGDQEYKSKYRELSKICASMEAATQFMKNKNACHSSMKVFDCIKSSLPVLELHLSEAYLNDVSEILLKKTKHFEMSDTEWSVARSVCLSLMAHNIEWVQARFYRMMVEMVRSVLVADEISQPEDEKCLTLLCDVGILTEICCHGLISKSKEVQVCASDIMLYLLRGRLVLGEGCWWRLLASLLPVLPLLHVYAAHDTQLGQAICKSLDVEIAQCMGVSMSEVTSGLVRLLFVRCPSVQMDAAYELCRLLDDEKFLPPKETLRVDVLMSALERLEPQEFNVDYNSSPSKVPTTTGLMQILDVLKQDIVLDEYGTEPARPYLTPALEPSLRRSTLQQLSVILRQQDLHDTFIQCDGLKVIVATLRMSMQVDDYLAFPECAISCVSVLNSVCFTSRHTLAKMPDLPFLLLRVILVFPANDSAVLMSAQILALVAWSGFVLQELDATRHRVPALPFSVIEHTKLPFVANSYWKSSPNVEHSSVEWLVSDEETRAAVRVRWWCAWAGSGRAARGAPPPPAAPALRPTARDLAALRTACPAFSCTAALLDLENATAHRQVNEALIMLESYTHLLPISLVSTEEFGALPWQHTRRFLCAPPASSRDTALLISLLRFIIAYMDNVPNDYVSMSWIKSSFIGNDASVISLLSRDELYIEQTAQESIEVTQLHTYIVKVLLRCIILLEHHDDYESSRMESLVKILLACLERVDLKNFHMLGYLNELVRCLRYAVNSRCCKLSEDTLLQCLRLTAATLAGCAAGGGRKGQACRLDALMALLALQAQIHHEAIPVQRWSESWSSDAVRAAVTCVSGARPELRAAAVYVLAALAHHAQMLPHILQAIPVDSLSEYAAKIFAEDREANVVRSAAAALLTAVAARASPHTDVFEIDLLAHLIENNFLENCLDILIDFCSERSHNNDLEPNVPRSVLERRSELEVRAQKCGDTHVSPALVTYSGRPPPTPSLVADVADVLYNVGAFPRCPVQVWNDHGLYRLLFRCASWSKGSATEMHRVRLASCRVLAAASAHKCVRITLATTKDCLLSVLAIMTPFNEEETQAVNVEMFSHALLLLASLLSERAASDTVWKALRDESTAFLHLLLQCLQSKEIELQDAALQCLLQLSQSITHKKHPDKTKDKSRVEFFDNLKSPFVKEVLSGKQMNIESAKNDCQPEYMAEELCKVLINLYQKLSQEAKIFRNQDERWHRLCTCLSSLLSTSPRCRHYGVHRQLPQLLLSTLQAIRDRLSLQGSVEAIKSAAQNPTLRTLHYVLILIDCQMLNCAAAKEAFAEDGIAVSLNRLWLWCMLTEDLRDAVLHLLFTFSNDCPKAWAAMSVCVGGRSLAGEVCALCAKEATMQARPHPVTLLLLTLRILCRIVSHHQCRSIILKSEVIVSTYSARVRERASSGVGAEWARLVERAAREADGAGALLALRPLRAAPPVRARLLPALAHLARHRRAAVLQAPDLLELLSGTLLAGDVAEVVSAARAVWALAANNHKAKLMLRSAGVATAVQSALQNVQRMPSNPSTQRAQQLLLYVNSVLQTT